MWGLEMMKSQWDCFLQNLGTWQGSFTTLSPEGELREDVPSRLTLEHTEPQTAKLTLKRDSPRYPEPLVMEFSTFSRDLLFFESGAFCQGSMQFATSGPFGAEFCLVVGDRRLRMVQMYRSGAVLDYFALIREQRFGSGAPERPKLTVEDLIGTWQGEAITLFPDWHTEEYITEMRIDRSADKLIQNLAFAGRQITTEADIEGDRLLYKNSPLPVQILLLPDGASANCPVEIKPGLPFVLEMGWLLEPGVRQRIMRTFNAQGEWVNVTLSTERRVAA
jgi:hypothetical protein